MLDWLFNLSSDTVQRIFWFTLIIIFQLFFGRIAPFLQACYFWSIRVSQELMNLLLKQKRESAVNKMFIESLTSRFFGGLKIKKIPLKIVLLSVLIPLIFDLLYSILNPGASINPLKSSPIEAVILVPLIEEFVYRGLVLGIFLLVLELPVIKRKLNSDVRAIVVFVLVLIQAVIFAFSHESKTLAVLIFGVILGFLFIGHKSIKSENNILPGIIAHAIHNLTIVILLNII